MPGLSSSTGKEVVAAGRPTAQKASRPRRAAVVRIVIGMLNLEDTVKPMKSQGPRGIEVDRADIGEVLSVHRFSADAAIFQPLCVLLRQLLVVVRDRD